MNEVGMLTHLHFNIAMQPVALKLHDNNNTWISQFWKNLFTVDCMHMPRKIEYYMQGEGERVQDGVPS